MCIRPTWKKLKNWWKTPKKNKLGGAIFHILGWEDLILIVRILVLPNVIYRFNTNSVKTPADYYANLVKLIQKFVWRDRRLETVNPTLKSKVGRARLPDLDLLESYDNQECDYKREEEEWYWRNNGQQVNWKNIEPHDWPTGIQWVQSSQGSVDSTRAQTRHFQKTVLEQWEVQVQKVNLGLPWWHGGQGSGCQCRDTGSIPGLRRCHITWVNKAHVPQLLCPCSGVRKLQLLKPMCWDPVLHNGRSCHDEKPAYRTTKSSNFQHQGYHSSIIRGYTWKVFGPSHQ